MVNLKLGDLFIRPSTFGRREGLYLVVDAERFGTDTSAVTAVRLDQTQTSWIEGFERTGYEAVGNGPVIEGSYRRWASTAQGRVINNATIEGMRGEIIEGLRVLFGRYPHLQSKMVQSSVRRTLMSQILLDIAREAEAE